MKRQPTQHDTVITLVMPTHLGPALRSAIDEIRNEIGGRLQALHAWPKEDALTKGAAALGILAAQINPLFPEHPDWE